MVRRFDEPVQVRMEEVDTPAAFLWRGRLYLVREVLGQWRERRSWWRESATGAAASERRVWRVEAGAGAGGARGVFDLGLDGAGADGPWLLLRTQD